MKRLKIRHEMGDVQFEVSARSSGYLLSVRKFVVRFPLRYIITEQDMALLLFS